MRNFRRTAASLLVLAMFATACGSDEPEADGDAPAAVDAGADESAVQDDAADTAEPLDGDDATADGDDPAPAASTDPSGDPSQAPEPEPQPTQTADPDPDAAAPVPAAPGTYRYATEGESAVGGSTRDMPAETLSIIQPAQGTVQTRLRDTRDEDGLGTANETTIDYGPDGSVLQSAKFNSTVKVLGSNFTDERNLVAMPPAVIAEPGTGVGYEATFHLEGDGVVVDGQLAVVGAETLTIGGVDVDVLRVEVVYELSGDIQGTSSFVWWIRPSDQLLVKESEETDATSQGVNFTSSSTSILKSLDPS